MHYLCSFKQKTLSEASGAAESVAMKGDAEAEAIEIKAKAEAESMAMKADAWKEYRKAAKLQMWMEALPTIAAEVAAPLSQTNKVTMVGFTGMHFRAVIKEINEIRNMNWVCVSVYSTKNRSHGICLDVLSRGCLINRFS